MSSRFSITLSVIETVCLGSPGVIDAEVVDLADANFKFKIRSDAAGIHEIVAGLAKHFERAGMVGDCAESWQEQSCRSDSAARETKRYGP